MKRLPLALLTSAILGVFCIIGVSIRLGVNELFLISTFVNRLIIGLVIGLAPYYKIKSTTNNIVLRGALLGFIISGSLYLSTNFIDTPGFFAGIVYGMIIDYVATRYSK